MQAPATPARPGRPDSRAGGPSASAQQPAAGPSTSTSPTKAGPATTTGAAPDNDLWTEILRGADRQKALSRKNVVLLSERHRGRRSLLDKLVGKRRTREAPSALAIGYDVLEQADRDEDAAPPVSVFYPPSSHPGLLRLVDVSLPPHALPDTAVVIVLDWTKPSTMVRELLAWLAWVDQWSARADKGHSDGDDLHERLQSHIQHYTEPPASSGGAQPASIAGYSASAALGTLLPLGPGTLTRNPSGVPIVVVCTRADLMDNVGDEMGMKGGGWEERTDWIQQVLRTVCLAYGAALFYTAPTQPQTYTLLRDYLFYRLYTVPPPLTQQPGSSETSAAPPTRFPFPHRANVLDRDAVLVPAGWDSWGKINVLRDGFDPARVGRAWDASAARQSGSGTAADTDDETIEDLWVAMVPDTERPKLPNTSAVTTTSEVEQTFLARQLDVLLKDPNRDARAAFRHAANSASAAGATGSSAAGGGGAAGGDAAGGDRYSGVVGPMGTGGLSLPGVEKAMAEMEGSVDDAGQRLARLTRRESTTPTTPAATPGARAPVAQQNEALHNFFQGLLAKKSATTPSKPPPK